MEKTKVANRNGKYRVGAFFTNVSVATEYKSIMFKIEKKTDSKIITSRLSKLHLGKKRIDDKFDEKLVVSIWSENYVSSILVCAWSIETHS